jgi:hypothetical protein
MKTYDAIYGKILTFKKLCTCSHLNNVINMGANMLSTTFLENTNHLYPIFRSTFAHNYFFP